MANRAYVGGFLLLALTAPVATRSTVLEHQSAAQATVEHPVQLACDLAHSIAATSPEASIQRSTGVFTHEALQGPVRGCRLAITGSFENVPPGEDAANRLRDGFTAQGWREMLAYSADGKDGTAFALRKAEVACLFRGMWNGGFDSEFPIPREQAYTVSVLCTSPLPPEERRHQ
jgi:hypothetical protein